MIVRDMQQADIYSGSLILVNSRYAYEGSGRQQVELPGAAVRLDQETAAALSELMDAIRGWKQIVPVSGWRSMEEQQQIWDDSLAGHGQEFTETYVAVPGHSEHQTGLAIDLGEKKEEIDFIRPDFPYTGICQVFREKAAGFGFVERYPKGKEGVTGIGHEPWHFRYVGRPHASIMTEQGMVLEEYISFLRQFPAGDPYVALEGGQEARIFYAEAALEGATRLELDKGASVSGNNVDGFIITEWRHVHA